MITFFDKYGYPVAYSDDQENIFLFSGQPVAYIREDSIYAFHGKHLGWFLNGWVRDIDGDAVFFTEIAEGGPLKPLKQLRPLRNLKLLKPLRDIRELRPLKPIRTLDWSSLSGEDFFFQD